MLRVVLGSGAGTSPSPISLTSGEVARRPCQAHPREGPGLGCLQNCRYLSAIKVGSGKLPLP
jgi:hypothetical protein